MHKRSWPQNVLHWAVDHFLWDATSLYREHLGRYLYDKWLQYLGTGVLVAIGLGGWAWLTRLPGPEVAVVFLAAFVCALATIALGLNLLDKWRMSEDHAGESQDLSKHNDLTEAPRVLLSCLGRGTDLVVENLGTEALNVQLVRLQSENYWLESVVIRYMPHGEKQPFILRCGQRSGTLVFQNFSNPSLFFNDLFERYAYSGSDMLGALEHTLRLLDETNLLVDFEISYSDASGRTHFTSAATVKWDRLREAIIDVEPKGIKQRDR